MKYCEIKNMDVGNGPGIRVSLFVSGCKFNCKGCFNQEAQNFDYGQEFTEETKKKILEQISRPYVAGLSILGGDPLWQSYDGMLDLAKLAFEVRQMGKTVWIWSGFQWEDIMIKNASADSIDFARYALVLLCDVFVDGRFVKKFKDLSLKWRGSRNQRVIDVQASKKTGGLVLYEE